jgi:DNA repair exonuclease SbcCD ATPase subunit
MSDFDEKILSKETETPAAEIVTPQAEETPPTIPATESRTRSFLRNLIRWTLTLLITFGLGALAVYFALLSPARKELAQSSAELDKITQQAESLTNQLDDVNETNQELERELKSAQVRLVLLDAISDVRAANLAVANDDYPGALLSLKEATQALEQLSETVSKEQKEIVTALQNNLAEIEDEVKNDPESTKMDLDRLTTNLIKLENSILK